MDWNRIPPYLKFFWGCAAVMMVSLALFAIAGSRVGFVFYVIGIGVLASIAVWLKLGRRS